jgi:tripeptidyl-peptidase-1
MDQFNTEAMKLSVMGVTISVASGDFGANNYGCECSKDSSNSASSWTGTNTWNGEGYFPSFPATSPYVTAVGATMGPESGDTEIACQSQLGGVVSSGGGFSTYYAQPEWQAAAVSQYFSNLSLQPAVGYNAGGRGFPDVSLVGVNYQVVIDGTVRSIYGTSCTAPVFAAFISLINSNRIQQGKSAVGFINPTLYSADQSLFNDITSGNNQCCVSFVATDALCCNSGFVSSTGWDPVTGWGSIKFPNLLQLLG